MMTFVHDHVSVPRHDVPVASRKALQHADVDNSCGFSPAAADLADLTRLQIEENRQLSSPLIEKLRAVHKDERAASTCGYQVRAQNRLPTARGATKTPISWASNARTACCCRAVNLPRNSTPIASPSNL